MEVSGQFSRPGRFTPRERAPWYPLDRRLGGFQSRSGRSGLEKIPSTRRESEPDRPARGMGKPLCVTVENNHHK
jgi:hypothetical protein